MIHKYYLNGIYIVLDINSGAVHVADKLFFRLLDYVEPPFADECPQEAVNALEDEFSADDIAQAYRELIELVESQSLYSDDGEELPIMENAPLKALCLHMAHDCNLRCDYCFAQTGGFGGERGLMSFDTAKAAIDMLIARSFGRRNLEVDFFGGEPLMNFSAIRETVEYARSKEIKHDKCFRFTLTTNGLLLNDEIIDYINSEMSNVVLSLDGRPEVNDRMRRKPCGAGSYDTIVPLFQKLAEKRGFDNYYVRGTFTKYNKDFADDVKHINSLGFDQISIEPVVSDMALPYSLSADDLPEIFLEYERLANYIIDKKEIGQGFNFFHYMVDLEHGPCVIKRAKGCGAGSEYMAVAPNGDIYPCHQFAGDPGWKMGTVFDGIMNERLYSRFAGKTINDNAECRHCWAKFYCGGGCCANNEQYGGEGKPYSIGCEMQKKRIECAIMIKAALS